MKTTLKNTPLLEVKNLCKKFPIHKSLLGRPKQFIPVVEKVSFELFENEIIGVVGESGSGKSTLCRLIMQLIPADSGEIWFQGECISHLKAKQNFLRKNMQMIFQDTQDALNPRFTAEELVIEPLVIHRYKNKEERKKRVRYLFDLVGLSKGDLGKYAHEFSGGQKQRIGIARALALSPKVVVADEPVSALDISIQSQILKLFSDIQKELKISFLFISHDLNVVRKMCQRTLILYLGKIVEFGDCEQIFSNPQHPYTKILIDSILQISPHQKFSIKPIEGEIASFTNLPEGCYFAPRCRYKSSECQVYPPLKKKKTPTGSALVACWNSDKIAQN
jgi:oligopeptide/dipeptide ABC transporter ATP-binding protein